MKLIKALWWGELPLWKTYWQYGVGVNLLLAAVLLTLQLNSLRLISAVPGFVWIFRAVWFFAVLYGLFMVGAVWRSAGNYKGSGVYKVLARVAAVVGAIQVVRAVVETVAPAGIDEYSLRDEADKANLQLPVVLNDNIRFDAVTTEGMSMTYHYTVTTVPAAAINRSGFDAVRSQTCDQQRRYLDAGVTLIFSYRGNDGVAGPVLTVDRDSCTQ